MPREDPLFAAMKQRIVEAGYTVVTPAEAAERLFVQLELRLIAMHMQQGGLVLNRSVMREARAYERRGITPEHVGVASMHGVLSSCDPTPEDLRMVARQLAHWLMKERFEGPSLLEGDRKG